LFKRKYLRLYGEIQFLKSCVINKHGGCAVFKQKAGVLPDKINGNFQVALRIKFVSTQETKEMSLTVTITVDCYSLEMLHCTTDFREVFASFSFGVSAYLMGKMWDVELQK